MIVTAQDRREGTLVARTRVSTPVTLAQAHPSDLPSTRQPFVHSATSLRDHHRLSDFFLNH